MSSGVMAAGLLFLSAAPAYAVGAEVEGAAQEKSREKSGIKGRRFDIYLKDRERVEVPHDLSAVSIYAWVQTRSGFVRYEGQGTAQGTFTVAGVPRGARYSLWVGDLYVSGTERELDLSREYLGRPDAAVPSEPTALTFNVDGLTPWRTGDTLQLFSGGAATALFDVQDSFEAGPLSEGDTRLQGALVDFSAQPFGTLIDGTRGDTALVTRLSAKVSGDKSYQAVTQVFRPAPFTMVAGQETVIQGSFQDVPQRELLVYDYRTSSFDTHLADVHPRAVPSATRASLFTVSVAPYTAKHGYYATAIPDVLAAPLEEGRPVPMTYGNPYPRDWPLVISFARYSSVAFSLNGTQPWVATGMFGTTAELSGSPYQRIEPLMSPVRDIRVDGVSADDDQALGSLTPTLRWAPPAVGRPGNHLVTFFRLTEDGTRTRIQGTVTFMTAERELTVPPGVLVPGAAYVARIQSLREGNVDLSRYLFRQDFPNAYAYAFTGILHAP
ncbi:hypothetical protein HPC49_37560 [Pyxidicoccus fallax]|uniref:Uncharacterized protein n=1 Tax=Pyxidicoccus fallax TaxID=394095 RepID=A0A848LWX7_9BACT|nr:hypothetical protein [Pyxidicoccus fallax]NMO22286.1 hypothetical protein [Pyxidicoccus fallax]NPC83910.1 hypothetical protein [Pyxidicoccus fallax]